MRRITAWLLSTISALVLLFSYHTPTTSTAASSIVAESDTATEVPAASASSTTVTGDAVMTRFGNVQVQITVENGTITASEVTQVPWDDRKDQEINGRAVPVLNAAAVDAQSSDIDMVSGATYTSEAYIESLQSAIDRANQ